MIPNKSVFRVVDTVLVKLWTAVMVIAIAAMSVFTLAQVAMRVLRLDSWPPFTELIAFGFTTATFSGGALLFRGMYHLAVTYFIDLLRGVPRRIGVYLCDLLTLAALVLLIYLSIGFVETGMRQISPTMHFPVGYVYIVVPLSLISAAYFHMVHGFDPDWTDDERGESDSIVIDESVIADRSVTQDKNENESE